MKKESLKARENAEAIYLRHWQLTEEKKVMEDKLKRIDLELLEVNRKIKGEKPIIDKVKPTG